MVRLLLHRLGQQRYQPGLAPHRGVLAQRADLDRQLAAPGELTRSRQQRLANLDPHTVVRMADVEAQGGTPGNHVRDPRFHVEHADGRDQAGLGRRRGLDRQHQLRGGGQRVSAPVHRHGPRVARLAGELDQHPALARDRRDDADGQGTRLEHRPLLDVHLAVTEEVAAHLVIGDSRRVAAERANRFGHGDAGRVGPLQVAGVKGAGHRAAAEVGGAVAKSFLVGEG